MSNEYLEMIGSSERKPPVVTRDDIQEWFDADLRLTARNFFEETFKLAGVNTQSRDSVRYISGLIEYAVDAMKEGMNDVIMDAQNAERDAWEQFANYAGLDPDLFGLIQLPATDDDEPEDGEFYWPPADEADLPVDGTL